MKLTDILAKKKQAIIAKWFDATIESYPAETFKFLKSQNDPFANPVGETTFHGLNALFDTLLTHSDRETIVSFLDPIIRIRAVQDFTPSRATVFIFNLKAVVRNQLSRELNSLDAKELFDLDSRIDEMGMIAFDIYTGCREKIYNLKANESRKQFFGALNRAGLIDETAAGGPGL